MPWPTGCEWCSFLCHWTEWLRSLNMANRKSVTLHISPLYAVSAYKQRNVNGTSCFPPLWSLSTCHPINRMKWVAMYVFSHGGIHIMCHPRMSVSQSFHVLCRSCLLTNWHGIFSLWETSWNLTSWLTGTGGWHWILSRFKSYPITNRLWVIFHLNFGMVFHSDLPQPTGSEC
jgi:hypothetical protein